MRLLFVMSVILQNGIIAVPNQPAELLEQYKEQQLHIQRLETAVQKLIDENENLNQKIDGLMTSKVVLHADMEDKIASQNDKIARQNDMIASRTEKIASLSDKIASQTDKIDIIQVSFPKSSISKIHSADFEFYGIKLKNQTSKINGTDLFLFLKF